MAKNETIKMSFLGFKFECTNPTVNAIIILGLVLTFLGLVFAFLPRLSTYQLMSG